MWCVAERDGTFIDVWSESSAEVILISDSEDEIPSSIDSRKRKRKSRNDENSRQRKRKEDYELGILLKKGVNFVYRVRHADGTTAWLGGQIRSELKKYKGVPWVKKVKWDVKETAPSQDYMWKFSADGFNPHKCDAKGGWYFSELALNEKLSAALERRPIAGESLSNPPAAPAEEAAAQAMLTVPPARGRGRPRKFTGDCFGEIVAGPADGEKERCLRQGDAAAAVHGSPQVASSHVGTRGHSRRCLAELTISSAPPIPPTTLVAPPLAPLLAPLLASAPLTRTSFIYDTDTLCLRLRSICTGTQVAELRVDAFHCKPSCQLQSGLVKAELAATHPGAIVVYVSWLEVVKASQKHKLGISMIVLLQLLIAELCPKRKLVMLLAVMPNGSFTSENAHKLL